MNPHDITGDIKTPEPQLTLLEICCSVVIFAFITSILVAGAL